MFATLPDFTPRESHSLWYSSSRGPAQSHHHAQQHHHHHHHPNDHPPQPHQQRQRGQVLERSTLHRLAINEITSHRRRANVANFGSYWLKPPGVPKTLHQMREEKREHDEHQEAMRREQLAQDLAEAEAAGMPGEEGDEGMDDVQLDGAQDLDDDIPDAGDDFFAADDDDDDDDDDDEEGVEDEDDDGEEALREERQNDIRAARMRMGDDAFRQVLMLGDPDGDGMYGGEEELEEEGQGHMLDEDDFVQSGMDDGMGDMDADLDEEIPEAEDGGYEHTDSEAELSTSDSDDAGYADQEEDHIGHSMDYGPRGSQVMGPPQSPTLRGREPPSATRQSLELSSILSHDDTSFMESSPAQGRRARQI